MKQEIHKVHVSNSISAHIDPVQRQDILWGGVTDWIKSTEFAVNRTLADQEMSLQKTRKTELFCKVDDWGHKKHIAERTFADDFFRRQ